MSRESVVGLVAGTAPSGWATALTWVASDALSAVTGQASEKNALVAFARTAGVDAAVVDAGASWASAAVADLHAAGIAALWAVHGHIGRLASREGWPSAIRLLSDVARLEAVLEQLDTAIVSDASLAREAGADVLVLADDLAGADWLVQPQVAESLVGRYRGVVEVWAGPAVFHSDGNIAAVLPAVARAGFSAVHFGGSSGDRVETLFDAAWRSGLCPMGGIALCTKDDAAGLRGLASRGPCVIADDGGTASEADAKALAEAFAAIQAGV